MCSFSSSPLLLLLLLLTLSLIPETSCALLGLSNQKSVDWSQVDGIIDSYNISNIYVRISDDTGILYEHSKGTTTASSLMNVASASKWFLSTILHDLMEQGYLRLTNKMQDFFDFWTNDPSDPRSQITLQHMFSFTTGYSVDDNCISVGSYSEYACLQEIYANQTLTYTPGTTFYYAATHLYLAKMMATNSTGLSYDLPTVLVPPL